MSNAPSQSPNPAVLARLSPLTALLTRSHGPRLRTVTAYGEWLHTPDDRRRPDHVLVVITDSTPDGMRPTRPKSAQFGRLGLVAAFLELQAISIPRSSSRRIPEMQSRYDVCSATIC